MGSAVSAPFEETGRAFKSGNVGRIVGSVARIGLAAGTAGSSEALYGTTVKPQKDAAETAKHELEDQKLTAQSNQSALIEALKPKRTTQGYSNLNPMDRRRKILDGMRSGITSTIVAPLGGAAGKEKLGA